MRVRERQHRQDQQTEQAIKVRQVTEVHGNFSEQERETAGKERVGAK